jgi:hypothetical protein
VETRAEAEARIDADQADGGTCQSGWTKVLGCNEDHCCTIGRSAHEGPSSAAFVTRRAGQVPATVSVARMLSRD